MNAKGRPVLGGIAGFFAGVFLGLDLFLFGAVESDSVLLLVLPFLLAAVGVALGIAAPIKRGGREPQSTETRDIDELDLA